MSTALYDIYTPDGFLVAADGRERRHDLSIFSDATQKIFPIHDTAGALAVSISGAAVLNPVGSDESLMAFRAEIERFAGTVAHRQSKNLFGYGTRLSAALNTALGAVRATGRLERYPSGNPNGNLNVIARVFLRGFYHGKAVRARMVFSHTDETLDDPEIICTEAEPFSHEMVGSRAVAEVIFTTRNPHFAQYRGSTKSLNDVIARAKGFILAHNDPEAVAVDPTGCAGVGGHIHIARVTLEDGFFWLPGYEPTVPTAGQSHTGA